MLEISDKDGVLGTVELCAGRLTGSSPGMQRLADRITRLAGSPQAAYTRLRELDNGYMRAVER